MTKIGGGLSRFLAHHEGLRVDKAEGIDDNLSFDGLYRINNDGNGARSELFEGLLGVDVDRGEPAAEAGVGMIPTHHCFLSVEMQ